MAARVLKSRARAPNRAGNQFLSIRSMSTITSTRIAMVCPFRTRALLFSRRDDQPCPARKKTETADGRNRSKPPDICQRHHI